MTQISGVPEQPHYAIITVLSIYTPGDERSRTNPGHGYPAGTDTYLEYKAFTDRDEWEGRIELLMRAGTSFRAITATPAKVSTKVTVTTDRVTPVA
jgi:hypothetical protein